MAFVVGQQVLGQYVVEAMIGKGAMGAVYRGRHERLGRAVALKVLIGESDAREIARFEREARLLARVRHPNIVQILDYGQVDGVPCMVMEYVKGESLADRLYQVGALSLDQALDIFVGVLAGLDAIHTAGILHRDLKPSNISLAHGERETVKLLDFGIARSIEQDGPRLTHTGLVVGTPRYMSPEQLLNGRLDARSDVYSAALVLYEMLTGALPWDTETASQPVRRLAAVPARPVAPAPHPPISTALQDAILAALGRTPELRPGSARAFFELLRKARGPVSRKKRHEAAAAPSQPSPAPRMSLADAYSPTLELGRPSQPGPPPPAAIHLPLAQAPAPQAPAHNNPFPPPPAPGQAAVAHVAQGNSPFNPPAPPGPPAQGYGPASPPSASPLGPQAAGFVPPPAIGHAVFPVQNTPVPIGAFNPQTSQPLAPPAAALAQVHAPAAAPANPFAPPPAPSPSAPATQPAAAAFISLSNPPPVPFAAPLPMPLPASAVQPSPAPAPAPASVHNASAPGAHASFHPPQLQLRAVLVARIDPARLNRPDERQWLAAHAPPGARVFLHGTEYWMTALPATDTMNALELIAGSISRVTSRFGQGVQVAFATIGPGFTFPNTMVARTDALPGLLRRLVEQLASPGG